MDPLNDTTALDDQGDFSGDQGLPSEEALQAKDEASELARYREEKDREIEELRRGQAILDQRLRDTQAWGNNQNLARIAAEAAANAVDGREDRRAREANRPQAPRFSDEEKEAIYVDPDLLERKINEKVDYGIRFLAERIGPDLMRAREAAEQTGQHAELVARVAVDTARPIARAQAGMSDEDFDRCLPGSFALLQQQSGGNLHQLQRLATNPQAIALAAQIVRNQSGVPVDRSPAPPTIGAGRGRPGGGKGRPGDPAPAAVSKMEHALGVKLSPEGLAEFNRRKANAARGAA